MDRDIKRQKKTESLWSMKLAALPQFLSELGAGFLGSFGATKIIKAIASYGVGVAFPWTFLSSATVSGITGWLTTQKMKAINVDIYMRGLDMNPSRISWYKPNKEKLSVICAKYIDYYEK